jgi:hypothetical protein
MLTGQAKKDYQRDYMRKYRSNKKAKWDTVKAVRPALLDPENVRPKVLDPVRPEPIICKNCGGPVTNAAQVRSGYCSGLCERAFVAQSQRYTGPLTKEAQTKGKGA